MVERRAFQNRHKREGGFTLIELILSLTIMGFVLAILGTGFRLIGSGWERRSETAARQDMLLTGLDIIRRDIEGLERQISITDGVPGFAFKGTHRALEFIVIEPPYPSRSGPYRVNYAIERNAGGIALTRNRRTFSSHRGQISQYARSNKSPLIEGDYNYRFSFKPVAATADEWTTDWKDQNQLPGLIKLEIRDAKRNRPVMAPFIIRLRHDAELDCLSKKAETCTVELGGVLPEQRRQDDKPGGKKP